MVGRQHLHEKKSIGHECALLGFALKKPSPNVYKLLAWGLDALNHRGQEGSGLAAVINGQIWIEKALGLRPTALSDDKLLSLGPTASLIGHTRYSITGESNNNNLQPFIFSSSGFAIAHNGNLIQIPKVKVNRNEPTSDTYRAAKAIAATSGNFLDKLTQILPQLKGSYIFLFLTEDNLYVASDPWGIRPCNIGQLRRTDGIEGLVAASETVAFPKVGAEFLQSVPRGSLMRVLPNKTEILWRDPRIDQVYQTRCSFEPAYFSDSASWTDPEVHGRLTNHSIRVKLGKKLAEWLLKKNLVDKKTIVVPVPKSGCSYAQGIQEITGLPHTEAVQAARRVERTFIAPSNRIEKVALKFNFIPEEIEGERIILVDDSIIRGNTMKGLILNLFNKKAKEIIVLVGIPPVRYICSLGIDFQNLKELIYHRLMDGKEDIALFEKKLTKWLIEERPELEGRLRIKFQELKNYVEIVSGVSSGTPISQSGGCYYCVSGILPKGIIFDIPTKRVSL